ncbi:MAG: cytochrome c oxidase subunit II [Sphaerobacter sp.]|nr:cytochrome c oxidase subunit II [Sphaerobacter sp.]
MKVEFYEKVFLVLTVVVLAAGLITIGASVLVAGVHVPSPAARVDPRTVAQTPPFDQPGLREIAPGKYEAVILARAWFYDPKEIRVPVGSTVTFKMTSADVVHGFELEGTTLNGMLIPGQVLTMTTTFEEPGEHLFICHEYCGVGHHTMFGRVVVE